MKQYTILYGAVKKYRRKFLICNIIFLALIAAFTFWRLPYLKTEFFGSTELDEKMFLSECGTFTIDEIIELDRHDNKEPETYYYKDICYWQNGSYLFDIDVDSLKKTGIIYKSTVKISDNNSIEYESAEIYLADIGGKKTAVIAEPDKKYGKTVTGYLVEPSKAVVSELSKMDYGADGLELLDYFIDCRDVDMETASSDALIFKLCLIILVALFVKLVVYYINPSLTPTFRQLRRYGNIEEVAADIERQAKSPDAYIEDKKLITADYILSDESFKKKVVKNHMAAF